MKKVAIVGGAGTIGTILSRGLFRKYDLYILDIQQPKEAEAITYIKVDATDYKQLLEVIPKDTDVLINLLTIRTDDDLEKVEHFQRMTDIHFVSTFYLLHAAVTLGIPKVVYASSNHTTDYYEEKGLSTLGREITISDYPISKGLYGVLKLASENIGHIFAKDKGLSVINLRIGSVHQDEKIAVQQDERLTHTLLSHDDTVNLFDLAIQTTVKYGTYYGVSSNKQKPWSTENAWRELGFKSSVNADDLT